MIDGVTHIAGGSDLLSVKQLSIVKCYDQQPGNIYKVASQLVSLREVLIEFFAAEDKKNPFPFGTIGLPINTHTRLPGIFWRCLGTLRPVKLSATHFGRECFALLRVMLTGTRTSYSGFASLSSL